MTRGGIDAEQQRQAGREPHRKQRQRDRHLEAGADELRDGDAVGVACAEVAVQHACEPFAVAKIGRLIEPELQSQGGERVGLGIGPEQYQRRVARQDLQDEEGDCGHREQRQRPTENAVEE